MTNFKTAVLVEDSEPNRIVAALHLKRAGFEVIAFENGARAWEYLSTSSAAVDLILSDYFMPEMNGIELLRRVKASTTHKQTPFVIISAVKDRQVMLESTELGISAYITKPLLSDTIPRVLAEINLNSAIVKRILLIDDDMTSRILSSRILKSAGFLVEECGGAAIALDKILTAIPIYDLIVSDVHMPEGSGFDLLSSVRSIGIRTPFLLMSVDANIRTLKIASGEADTLAFLEKSELIQTLVPAAKSLLAP